MSCSGWGRGESWFFVFFGWGWGGVVGCWKDGGRGVEEGGLREKRGIWGSRGYNGGNADFDSFSRSGEMGGCGWCLGRVDGWRGGRHH